MPRKIRVGLSLTGTILRPTGEIMIGHMRHASRNKFTLVALSLLFLAIIQSDLYQRGFKPFGEAGRAIARAQTHMPDPAVDVQLKIQIKEQHYCRATMADHNILQMVLSLDFINTG